jgi:hypothetical protein
MLSQCFSEMRQCVRLQPCARPQQSRCDAVVLKAKRVLKRTLTVRICQVNVSPVCEQKLNCGEVMARDGNEQRRAMLLIEARNVSTCGNPLAHHIQVPGTRREDQKLMNREHAKRHRVGESESLAQAPPQNRT